MDKNGPAEIFFVAPFAIDGRLIGLGEWRVSDLSPKWLCVCKQLLEDHGSHFRANLGQMLAHIEIKLTSARGAGLGTFSAHGHIAASTAYFRGEDVTAEEELLEMFIQSLGRTAIVRQSQASRRPFQEMAALKERPLHVVVAWPDAGIADQDQQLVAELANHFAAVYLCRYHD